MTQFEWMKVDPSRSRTFGQAIVLFVLGLVIYSGFVFGDKTLLYKDIGADSLNTFYPYYSLFSDYLRENGILSWSFRVGMGQDVYPYLGTALISPTVWLPKGQIATALVYQHLLYVVVVGLTFACFLRDRGLATASSMLGGILLSFSAYMCMGSCWYNQAQEAVGLTLSLFAAERAVSKGQWSYLVLAIVLVGMVSAFHLYLCALVLLFYVPARLIELHSWRPRPILRTSVLLAVLAALGAGVGAVVTLPNLYAMLHSPRGSGMVATTWPTPSLFQFDSALHYVTALTRWFSNDLLGSGTDFRGWKNYFEAPANYCGLFPLLIFPQVFANAARRQRILYGGFLCLVILPVIFPWLRHLFWLFQGGYYRALSLFSVLGLLTLGMTAFSRFINQERLNLPLLGLTLVLLIGVLYLPVANLETLIDAGIRRSITAFLVLYATLLIAGQMLKQQARVAWLILGLAAVELFHLDRITISNHPIVTKSELNQPVGYNDQTINAIRDIKTRDSSFFRLTKVWSSSPAFDSSLNDAMVFGYYGTSSYSSFNSLNYVKFLMAVDAISGADVASKTQWSQGLDEHRLLATFACEKYILTRNPIPFETADYYEFLARHDNVHVFKNQLFLPLGLVFDHYISKDEFMKLPSDWAKPLALLQTVVLSDNDGRGLSNLSGPELKRKMIETSLPELVAERRKTALDLRSFSQTRIEGTVRTEGKSILVIQTPFNPGWRASVDGRATTTFEADIGLLGVALDGGEQNIKLFYRTPFLYAGAIATLLSVCVLAWSVTKWPRIPLPE